MSDLKSVNASSMAIRSVIIKRKRIVGENELGGLLFDFVNENKLCDLYLINQIILVISEGL